LKITFLLPSTGIGGGTRAIVRFGNKLIEWDHKVRIFCRNDIRRLRDRIRKTYIRLVYSRAPNWFNQFRGGISVYDELNPDVFAPDELIVSMCAQTTLDMASLPDEVGIKVLYCHGVEIENWDRMLRGWQLPFPKIVVSSHLINIIKKETGQNILGVVPDGIDQSEYFPSVRETQRHGIGSIFGWSQSKNPSDIIRVMKMLRERLPDVPLYLFSSGKKPPGLRGVSFTRLPTVLQAREIYSRCKVWFLASTKEGFGMPILEAMACGCAVVSTNSGGPKDTIQDGVNGYLVDVGNTGAMVHKIVTLYENDEERKRFCTNAMKTAQEFTWTNAADKLEGYLYSIYDDKIS